MVLLITFFCRNFILCVQLYNFLYYDLERGYPILVTMAFKISTLTFFSSIRNLIKIIYNYNILIILFSECHSFNTAIDKQRSSRVYVLVA